MFTDEIWTRGSTAAGLHKPTLRPLLQPSWLRCREVKSPERNTLAVRLIKS